MIPLEPFKRWLAGDDLPLRELIRDAGELGLPDDEFVFLQALAVGLDKVPPTDPQQSVALLREFDFPDEASRLEEILHRAIDAEIGEENRKQEPEPLGSPTAALACLPQDPTPGDLEPALREFRRCVERLDAIQRVCARGEAIGVLALKGVIAAAKYVDAALENLNGVRSNSAGTGGVIPVREAEPWPEPVVGAKLLDDLVETLKTYLVLPPGSAEVMALWILFTHTIDAFDTSPRLVLSSPLKRCGKTRSLSLLGKLCRNPLIASNISPAAVFRVIGKSQPTLLIDEADTAIEGNEELRGILNSGHTRDAAFVVRVAGEAGDLEPRQFSTWAALAIALIGQLSGKWSTLEDRSIIVEMRRRLPRERIAKLRSKGNPDLKDLVRRAARWAEDNQLQLKKADPEIPQGLDDRAADNWTPLLAIADAAGGSWPPRARKVATVFSATRDEADSVVGVELLSDLRAWFEDHSGADRVTTEALLQYLHGLPERPWNEYGQRGKPITDRQLAALLKPFEVAPRRLRIGEDTSRGYLRETLEDSFSRYLPAFQPPRCHEADFQGENGVSRSATEEAAWHMENCEKARDFQACGAVPDGRAGDHGSAELNVPPHGWLPREDEAEPTVPTYEGPEGDDPAGPGLPKQEPTGPDIEEIVL